MTKKERVLVKKAINLLHKDEGWDEGIGILKKLVDPNWKDYLKDPSIERIGVWDLMKETEIDPQI